MTIANGFSANDTYVQHRNECKACMQVDFGIRPSMRCAKGAKAVRRAHNEAKRRRRMITAKDIVFLRDMGITL